MKHLQEYPTVELEGGVSRRVLAQNKTLMVVSFVFKKDGEGALHSHPHAQSTYVESGKFRFSINEDSFEVSAGDSFVIPSNAKHGCLCLEAGKLVDTFTPRRDDFL